MIRMIRLNNLLFEFRGFCCKLFLYGKGWVPSMWHPDWAKMWALADPQFYENMIKHDKTLILVPLHSQSISHPCLHVVFFLWVGWINVQTGWPTAPRRCIWQHKGHRKGPTLWTFCWGGFHEVGSVNEWVWIHLNQIGSIHNLYP